MNLKFLHTTKRQEIVKGILTNANPISISSTPNFPILNFAVILKIRTKTAIAVRPQTSLSKLGPALYKSSLDDKDMASQ